jgi:serine/threonine protein kinase
VSGRKAQATLVLAFAQAEMLEDRGSDRHSAGTGKFAEAYQLGELLGIGSFGKVYRAISKAQPGQDFAVKIVSKHREGVLDERIARRIHDEVRER